MAAGLAVAGAAYALVPDSQAVKKVRELPPPLSRRTGRPIGRLPS